MFEIPYFVGALLALIGGALSFYFYSVYQGKLTGEQWWIPPYLRITSDSCSRVIDTTYGRHFGVPNAAFGAPFMIIYSIFLILAGIDLISDTITLFIGIITLCGAVYLIYGLWRIKMHCKICYSVHFLNLIIFILQVV